MNWTHLLDRVMSYLWFKSQIPCQTIEIPSYAINHAVLQFLRSMYVRVLFDNSESWKMYLRIEVCRISVFIRINWLRSCNMKISFCLQCLIFSWDGRYYRIIIIIKQLKYFVSIWFLKKIDLLDSFKWNWISWS